MKIALIMSIFCSSFLTLSSCKPKVEEASEVKEANSLAEARRNRPFGIIASARHNFLALEFSTTAGMTFSERETLKEVVGLSRKLLSDIKNKKLAPDQVISRFFTGRNQTNLSLYFRFMEIADNYPEILEMRGANSDLIKRPVLFDDSKNDMFSENKYQHISECGLELMYLASTAFAVATNAEKAVALISGRRGDLKISDFRRFSRELKSRFVKPLMRYYSKNIKSTNIVTIKRGVTDYNMNFYSDAIMSDWLYKNVSKFN